MPIGDRIKQARILKGLTQSELAEACNTTKQCIYKYETGIVTNIPSDRIESLAVALNVSPAYLMGWTADFISETEKSSSHDSRREALRKTLESLSDESLIELQEYIKYLIWKEKQAQHKRE